MSTYIKYLKKFEKPIKKKGLTITVTGFSGSGKSTVAEAIAKAFKLKIFNVGDIQRKFARQKKISVYQASAILPKSLDHEMDKVSLKAAMTGGYVLLGRLAGWTAGDWADCKIFIDCQKKIRAHRVAKRDHLTIKEALIKVNQRDADDQRRYYNLYKINTNQRKIYDFIIKNDKPGREKIKNEAVQKIKKFLKKKNNIYFCQNNIRVDR